MRFEQRKVFRRSPGKQIFNRSHSDISGKSGIFAFLCQFEWQTNRIPKMARIAANLLSITHTTYPSGNHSLIFHSNYVRFALPHSSIISNSREIQLELDMSPPRDKIISIFAIQIQREVHYHMIRN